MQHSIFFVEVERLSNGPHGSTKSKIVALGDISNKFIEHMKTQGCELLHVDNLDECTINNDLIVTCGYFTKCGDSLVQTTLEKILNCLKVGGRFVFCETCFETCPGDGTYGTYVRCPEFYSSYVESVVIASQNSGSITHFSFEITLSKVLKSTSQVLWVVTKVRSNECDFFGYKTFQEFLNKKQYSRNGVLRYEKIFGDGFISTGGMDTTKEFVELLKLEPGEHVLDVGAGIGGGAFYMAQNHGVSVTGVDLSSNIVAIALDRLNRLKIENVTFEICDATKRDFANETFDVIYSRDTILHISDKGLLFSLFLKWLKPGGRLLISDYCCLDSEWSEEYTKYVKERGYFLLSPEKYGKLFQEVGFVNVKAEDRTDQLSEMLKKELERITNNKDTFLMEFSLSDYNDLVTGWQDKLRRCAEGYQRWGLFYAEKVK